MMTFMNRKCVFYLWPLLLSLMSMSCEREEMEHHILTVINNSGVNIHILDTFDQEDGRPIGNYMFLPDGSSFEILEYNFVCKDRLLSPFQCLLKSIIEDKGQCHIDLYRSDLEIDKWTEELALDELYDENLLNAWSTDDVIYNRHFFKEESWELTRNSNTYYWTFTILPEDLEGGTE